MPWIKLTFHATLDRTEDLSDALAALGAVAVTIELGDESAPGTDSVSGLFGGDCAPHEILAALNERLGAPLAAQVATLPDEDWARVWMDRYRPIAVGRRLWVCPSWCTPPHPEAVNVILDPGLAFGTGTHASTALCLQWLSERRLAGREILDYGCGSGILAIAALKLGAARAVGVDMDAQALAVARANAARNGVAERFAALPPEALAAQQADVVVANILASTLIDLAPEMARRVRPGGEIALSGILDADAGAVRRPYRAHFTLRRREHDGWSLLAGRRRGG